MGAYIARRLLLVIPTLLGILVINFALTQFVPGGPIEPADVSGCTLHAWLWGSTSSRSCGSSSDMAVLALCPQARLFVLESCKRPSGETGEDSVERKCRRLTLSSEDFDRGMRPLCALAC